MIGPKQMIPNPAYEEAPYEMKYDFPYGWRIYLREGFNPDGTRMTEEELIEDAFKFKS